MPAKLPEPVTTLEALLGSSSEAEEYRDAAKRLMEVIGAADRLDPVEASQLYRRARGKLMENSLVSEHLPEVIRNNATWPGARDAIHQLWGSRSTTIQRQLAESIFMSEEELVETAPRPTRERRAEKLTDPEAAQRLLAVVSAVADGNYDLSNDRAYQAVRKQFMGRAEYVDVLPSFIRVYRDIQTLGRHLRDLAKARTERREKIQEAVRPLIDRAEGRTKPQHQSAKWTGRRTVKQQVGVVLALGPTALHAVEMLLEDQEAPLHNGGPVEPERMEAIEHLRALHAALGELLELAQSGQSLERQLKRVRAAKDKVLRWSQDTFDLCAGQTVLMANSAVFGSAVWYLTNLITKDIGASATFAAGAMATGAVAATKKAPAATRTS